ncbi:hypothetical protein BRY73_18315 [Ochrobactrum sp. P6BS-III]|nr:hypothetical protein BRY73_18315 [Ochrobactrum sp. P6BS-III]
MGRSWPAMRYSNEMNSESKSLFQKSPCVAANGNFLHSGAHVPLVRSAPVLENHHFRTHKPLFDSGSKTTCRRLALWQAAK